MPLTAPTRNICTLLEQARYGKKVSIEPHKAKFKHDFFVKNAAEKKFEMTVAHGHQKGILASDIYKHFTVTASYDKTVKLWNLEKDVCEWTFEVKKIDFSSLGKLIIVPEGPVQHEKNNSAGTAAKTGDFAHGHIIFCHKRTVSPGETYTDIYCIDFLTGMQLSTFQHEDFISSSIAVIKNKIFATLTEKRIGQFDYMGRCLSVLPIPSIPLYTSPELLRAGNLLVFLSENIIQINDISEDPKTPLNHFPAKRIQLMVTENGVAVCQNAMEAGAAYRKGVHITSHYIDDFQLVCCVSTGAHTNPILLGIIDLRSGNMIDQYCIEGNDSANKVIKYKEYLYLGCDTGRVYAVHLGLKIHVVLGIHNCVVHKLLIKNDILLSASNNSLQCQGQLMIWDLRTIKQNWQQNVEKNRQEIEKQKEEFLAEPIRTISFPNLREIFLRSSQIQVIWTNLLVQWDFTGVRKKVKFIPYVEEPEEDHLQAVDFL